ncbi:hypothetical protein F5144DRAFT_546060 [Chaetomium tenue]|uniref:Uncharacterized protein n=1 Tax=Chaetomium tenue TaxID=1854479 RepID=A0ACB7PD17_9PEZI|nr:hypothetical protein F5144DRAFT_546060 [Chaetomium globosum]
MSRGPLGIQPHAYGGRDNKSSWLNPAIGDYWRQPFLAHMDKFNQAITIFAQSDPVITSLVWGTVKMILDAASALSHTLETILDMLTSITGAMPRFEEYMQLFPQRERLQEALLRIYCSYLDFCLGAAKFLSVNIFAKFKELIQKLELASQDFGEEAKLAHVASTKAQLTNIREVLDLDKAPQAGPPFVFSAPWARNGKFLGREQELANLSRCLKPDSFKQQSCVLHGMAGVGKTQTALEFCYAQKSTFSYIIWLPSETQAVLAEGYSKIIRLIKGPEAGKSISIDPSADVDASRQWLCQSKGWLLIFDNVDDPDMLRRYWPACEHGSILITTQDRKLIHRAESEVCLKPFKDEEGSRLLLQNLPKQVSTSQGSAALARDISKEVDGLPLYLVGLAGFMVDSSTPLADTLGDLQNHVSQEWDSATFQYGKRANTAFDMSLKGLSPPALSVLRVISMLSPDSIPESLLLGQLDSSLEFGGLSGKTQFYREVRTPLRTRHLLDFHESTTPGVSHSYSIHRMLQKKVLGDMETDHVSRQQAFNRVVALVGNVFPPVTDFMVPIREDMILYKESIGHVTRLEAVFRIGNKTSKTPLVGDMAFVQLLIGAGFYLYEVRLGTPGLALLGTAEGICAARVVATDADSAKWIKLRATALQISWAIMGASTGIAERQKTTDKMAKVLELRKEYAAADRSHDKYVGRVLLANAHNDMAVQLLDNGEYDAAEDHVNISIRMKQELQSERIMPPYQFAEQNKNTALVHAGQGRTQESVDLSQEAVKVLPNEEEDGVRSIFLFVHGICLANAGNLLGALDVFMKCYKVRTTAFGIHGIPRLHSLYAIAYTQYRLGRYTEARDAIEKCRYDGKCGIWPSECILRADYLLSLITSAEGRQEEAAILQKPLLAQLHAIFVRHSPVVLNGRHVFNLSEPELTFLFDLLVPLDAGRFAMAHRISSSAAESRLETSDSFNLVAERARP